MARTGLPMKNYHQTEHGQGHVTDFELLGPLTILGMVEATDLKLDMWMEYVRH